MFMTKINNYKTDNAVTGYDESGAETLTRNFFLVAVGQCRPLGKERQETFNIKGKDKSKTVWDYNIASRVHGSCGAYFDINVPYPILEEIAVASAAGWIPKTTIVDLRIPNWKNIQDEYESETGLFAYRKKQKNLVL